MKSKPLFLIFAMIAVVLFCFPLLTACNDAQTLENLKNEYGVFVEGGGFQEGSVLVTKEIEPTSEEGKNALRAIGDQEYNVFRPVRIFDISVLKDNVKVQPDGKVKVVIPVSTMAGYTVVFHIKEDATVERLSATHADGKVTFETDSFSVFILAEPAVINHVHTFADGWSYDEYVHWHVATCEHADERNDENEHEWDGGSVIKPATEQEDGQIKYTCSVCGHEKVEPICLHKHTFSREWTQSETHHWHAATCEHTDLKDAYEEHYYEEHGWSIETPPTETEEGVRVRVCIGCKYEDREAIPKLNHVHTFSKDWTSDGEFHWHAATCSHTGERSDKALCDGGSATCTQRAVCSVCANEYGDLLLHDFTAKVLTEQYLATPATCQSHATYYYSCKKCGAKGNETFEDTNGKLVYCSYDETEVCTVCETPAGDWLKFELRADRESYKVTLSQSPYSRHIEYLRIPSTYNGKPVVEIADQALYFSNSELKHIVLPDSIQILGGNCLFSPNLETLTIGKGLKTIQTGSFGYGTGAGDRLRQITISEENPYFKMVDGVMYSKDGKTLIKYPALREGEAFTIDSKVEKIWGYAFENTQNLKSVVISDSVTEIISWAFCGSSITSVTIGLGIKTIPEYAFCGSKLKDLQLGGNISTIEYRAFANCYDLKSVSFGAKVKTIGERAFELCTVLAEIIIPDTVSTLGVGAFDRANGAAHIVIGSGIEEIPNDAFANATINVAKPSVTIGSNVKTIGNNAFENINVESITIPSSVKSIGCSAFKGCGKLRSLVIPNTVESLDVACFQDCKLLESVTLGSQLTEIPGSAFYRCSKLASISIPNSVKTVGEGAFFACQVLETVNFGTGLTAIRKGAFENCYALVSLTLPDGVEEIEHYAFKECTALKTVILPASVNKISNVTFKGCTALESVTFHNTTDKQMYLAYDGIYTYTFDTVEKTIAMLRNGPIGTMAYLYSLAAYNRSHPYNPIIADTKVTRWEERENA